MNKESFIREAGAVGEGGGREGGGCQGPVGSRGRGNTGCYALVIVLWA